MTRIALRHFVSDALFIGRRTLSPQIGYIEHLSPELKEIVPANARVEKIAEGFAYTEGPIWSPSGYLLFGDLPNNVIRRWDPGRNRQHHPEAKRIRSRGYSAEHSRSAPIPGCPVRREWRRSNRQPVRVASGSLARRGAVLSAD